jgi:hypothetical protein
MSFRDLADVRIHHAVISELVVVNNLNVVREQNNSQCKNYAESFGLSNARRKNTEKLKAKSVWRAK